MILNNSSRSGRILDIDVRQEQWQRLFKLGVVFLIAGILTIALSQFITSAVNVFLGVILLVTGVLSFVYAVSIRNYSQDRWPWYTAISLIIIGILLIINPTIGAISITLLLGIFFMFTGLGKLTLGQVVKNKPVSKWVLINGFIDILLSFLIFFNLQNFAAWLLGALLGISLCMQGLWNIRLAKNIQQISRQYSHI